MSNSSSYNGGSTLLDVPPTSLSGASPTSYFCGNLLWKQLVQQKKTTEVPVFVERLPAQPVVFPSSSSHYSQLHVMATQGNLQSATSYLEQCASGEINRQDHNGNTPLIWAALHGQEDLVQLLLDNSAAVNAQNFVGETALYLAASYGNDNIVTMLLEYGANANIANIDGVVPVHMAAAGGHMNTLEILARCGAFMNAQDDCGDTPLHYAVREGHLMVVERLVTRCNANVDICNEDQETPVELASSLGMNDGYVQFLSKFSLRSAMESGESR